MLKRHANIQHYDNIDLPLFGRGGISEDLKLILITSQIQYITVFAHLPCTSSNVIYYRSLESTLEGNFSKEKEFILCDDVDNEFSQGFEPPIHGFRSKNSTTELFDLMTDHERNV